MASAFAASAEPRQFVSSAISTPTPPKTVTIATWSLAGSVPMTEPYATSKNSSMLSAR